MFSAGRIRRVVAATPSLVALVRDTSEHDNGTCLWTVVVVRRYNIFKISGTSSPVSTIVPLSARLILASPIWLPSPVKFDWAT